MACLNIDLSDLEREPRHHGLSFGVGDDEGIPTGQPEQFLQIDDDEPVVGIGSVVLAGWYRAPDGKLRYYVADLPEDAELEPDYLGSMHETHIIWMTARDSSWVYREPLVVRPDRGNYIRTQYDQED